MKERKIVEPEPGVQDARCGCNALAHGERLSVNRLPGAQAVLRNLHVLEQCSGESRITVKAWNVILGW